MKKQSIYLIAHYSAKPKNPAKTHIPGYMKDPANVRYDEQVQVSTRLRPKDINMAKIIMNFLHKRGRYYICHFKELFKYFFKGYHKYITDVMVQLDAEYFSSILDELQAEVDAGKHDEETQTQ